MKDLSKMFCHDERHETPCPLPCVVCADECDHSTWGEEPPSGGPHSHEPVRMDIPISTYETITINVTSEGVIFDAFTTDGLAGTMAMTFAEWFDFITDDGQSEGHIIAMGTIHDKDA